MANYSGTKKKKTRINADYYVDESGKVSRVPYAEMTENKQRAYDERINRKMEKVIEEAWKEDDLNWEVRGYREEQTAKQVRDPITGKLVWEYGTQTVFNPEPLENRTPHFEENKQIKQRLVEGKQKAWEEGKKKRKVEINSIGDFAKSVGANVVDISANIVEGGLEMFEGAIDGGVYLVGGGLDLIGADGAAKKARQIAGANVVDDAFAPIYDAVDEYSTIGGTLEAVSEGVGQVASTMLTGGLAGYLGLTGKATSAVAIGTNALSSFGRGTDEAYEAGAKPGEAELFGFINSAADTATEMLFAGMGKGANVFGYNKALLNFDDALAKKITSKINSTLAKNLTQYAIKSGAEGVEEVLAGFIQAWGKSVTYMSEEDFMEILEDENLWDQFVVGMLTSAVVQSKDVVSNTKAGRDFVTGYDQNTQAVIKKETENRIAEAEKDGTKLSNKEKAAIEAQVEADMKRGAISTDLIESVVGGETYTKYQDARTKELEVLKELSNLYKGEELDAEVKKFLEGSESVALRNQLTQEAFNSVKGSYLAESYYDKSRRRQRFTADLSKYDDAQRAVVQKAIDSGVLNNTNRTHEFVDLVAKISADKGVLFDFVSNEKLRNSSFAVEGKTVNGFVDENGNIVLNANSSKSLNTVVGHEITHVLEGTELYGELQTAMVEYAKGKKSKSGKFDSEYMERLYNVRQLYKDVKGYEGVQGFDKIRKEVVADLVGDYLFTDPKFIHHLSTKHRNLAQKLYDEIKYMLKLATAGSKEARDLERVKKVFEDVYRGNVSNVNGEKNADNTKYSLENGNKRKYNKRSRYSETETLFMSWENGSSPVGEVKKFVRYGKTRYYEKTENGSVELSRSQYNERNVVYVEDIDRRAERRFGTTADYDASTQRGSLGYSDGYRDSGRNAAVFGQAISEKLQHDTAGSVSSTLGHDNRTDINKSEYNNEAPDDSGASSITFSNDYAAIRNFMKEGDSDIQYSLGEDTDIDPSNFYEVQSEVNRLTESIRDFEASAEWKAMMDKISEGIANDNADQVIKEYNQFVEESGYLALKEKRDSLRESLENARKKAEEDRVSEAVEQERSAIEKSGLSEADYFRKQAVKEFGYTPYFYDAGYIVTNGKMLNFSGEKGQHFGSRGQDHRAIETIYADTERSDALNRFVNEGNIRIVPESPGIDVSSTVEPTKEQYATIKKFLYQYADQEYFSIDISGPDGRVVGSLVYENRIYPAKVIGDLKHYYETGEIREQSSLGNFVYSLSAETDKSYLDAVNRGDTETAQEMVLEVAEDAGWAIRAYHGTSRGDRVGNVFLPERATSGPMSFFTSDRTVAEGYAKSKRDTSMAYDPDFASYETQFRIKTKSQDIPLHRAWGYLPFDARRRITEKAGQLRENWDGDNELILDTETNEANGGFQWQLKEARGNAITALTEQWLNSGTLFNEESRFLDVLEMAGVTEEVKKIGMDAPYFKDPNERHEKVYDTVLKITKPFDTATVDEQFVADLESWYEEQDQTKYVRENMESDLWDKNGIDAYEFADRLRRDIENGTAHAWTSIPDSVTDYLKSKGYDGIKDTGGKFWDGDHIVWIPFYSEQIKSAEPVTYDDKGNVIPLSERFNPDKKDIRYSLSQDSEGNQLTYEQEAYFEDSKARDKNGNLLKVYHTTNNDFTVFDKSRKGETTGDYNTYLGFFFADTPEYMNQFPEFKNGKTETYYLNMTNPIDMNNISKQAFIDIVEATGGDVDEAAELYDREYADELKRAEFRGDNSPIMDMSRLLEELTGDYFDYAEFYNALKPNYESLIAKGYDGFINTLDGRGWANEYIVLDSNQAKLTSNTNPTSDPDIRRSLSNEGDEHPVFGTYNVYGKDIAYEDDFAPVRETKAADQPIAETAEHPTAPAETAVETAETEQNVPIAENVPQTEAEMFPDENVPETDSEFQDRLDSLAEMDAPMERPVYDDAGQVDVIPITKKLADDIRREVRSSLGLSNKQMADVRAIIDKYTNSEFPSRDQLFAELKDKFGTYTESHADESVQDAKKYLRTVGVYVDDSIKHDIADYADFMRRNRGRIRFSNHGTSVDVLYQELNYLYPHLFPENIIVPADQFRQMVDVANMDSVTKYDIPLDDDAIYEVADNIMRRVGEYRQSQKLIQANRYARDSFDSLMQDADSHVPPVDLNKILANRRNPIGTTAPVASENVNSDMYNGVVKGQETYITTEDKLNNRPKPIGTETPDAPIFDAKGGQQAMWQEPTDLEKAYSRIDRILESDKAALAYEFEMKKKNVKDADTLRKLEADYRKKVAQLEYEANVKKKSAETANQRKVKDAERKAVVEDLVGDTTFWRDKKLGLSYQVNTLRRNLRDVVRDANGNRDIAKADAIYDWLQGSYNRNEATLKRESSRIKSQYFAEKITSAEDVYIQMLGEFRHNPDTTLTEDVVEEFYEKHKKQIDPIKVDRVITYARMTYDDLLLRVNAVLREQGMREIPYRQGYFPHFTNPKQGLLAKLLNWKTVDTEIPTDIAGLTEQFNPNRSWQSFNKERKGDTTDYSFLKGMDTYVHGALDWIYHIDDIQNRRAFENHLRYIHSEKGIQEQIDKIRSSDELDADEMQDQIDLVLAQAANPLNNFVTNLRSGTNTLANKKSAKDRAMEEDANRKVYSVMTNLNNRINANMVVGSFSAALSNIIPVTQSWMEVNPWYSVRALGDIVRSSIRDDGMVNKSDFLTNRLNNEENLHQTNWDKVSEKAAFIMEVIDNITSQTVWRSKYLQNLKNGMSEYDAIKNADQFAENVLAGRSRGNQPTIFDAKNPLTKIFTAFQLEVSNQYGYMFKDAPQDSTTKKRLIGGFAKAFLGAYLYNAVYSSLTGRDAAFDPIGIIEELLGDIGDDEEEPEDIILNFADNILEQVPFIGGLVGGGRVPISSAIPYEGDYKSLITDIANREVKAKELLKPLYYLAMPVGGGQLKKTVEGLSMFDDDHPIAGSYTDSGDLRFPVDDSFGSKLKAALFGQYSSKNAREYFDNEWAPLGKKQIQEYIDVDMPYSDYQEYREGLKGKTKIGEKADYISGLDLPIDKQNILINNQTDRKDPIDLTDYDQYPSWEDFDMAQTNPEKYSFLKENGISAIEYEELDEDTKSAYSWAYQNPGKYTLSKAVSSDLVTYKGYTKALSDIEADTDVNGKSISGSRKKKVIDYINGLDATYGEKIVLFKSEYPSDDTYNHEIIQYIESRNDFDFDDKRTVLVELGFTVYDDGRVTWD